MTRVIFSLYLVLLCLMSAASAATTPYASYFRVVPTGPSTSAVLFEPGPFPEQLGGFSPDDPPLPGLDENTEGVSVTEVFLPSTKRYYARFALRMSCHGPARASLGVSERTSCRFPNHGILCCAALNLSMYPISEFCSGNSLR